MSKNDDLVRRQVEFLREAANFFENRPTNGEDKAHWSNVYNAKNCRDIADTIERGAAQGVVTDAMVERAAEAARDHLEIDGDNEGPFIRFDSIENAMRAALETVFSATPPAPAPDAGECKTCGGTGFWYSELDERTEECPDCPTPQPPAVEAEAERYDVTDACGMAPAPNGKWVRFTTHRAVVGALKAKTDEIERLRRERRWTIERDGELLRVCRGDHDKAEKCEWETFVPASRLEAALKAKTDEIERLKNLVYRVRNEAICHSMEARGANATVNECYRAVTEGKGEPGNWHGAEPVKAELERLRQQLAEARSLHNHQVRRAEAAEASNKALREIVPGLDHVISWLENGCDRQAAAQELRIYQSRARALLSETGGE